MNAKQKFSLETVAYKEKANCSHFLLQSKLIT